MRLTTLATGLVALGGSFVQAATTFTPTRAPAYPLLVRSPYLNSWLQGESGGLLAGSWPKFWTGATLGWQGYVAVDGAVYNWMGGAPGPGPVDQVSVEYTSTKTIFTFDVAGKVTLTATFLSPIYADDLAKQSEQFAYLSLKAKSQDGTQHSVQIYTDVSGEWASGDVRQLLNWDFDTQGGVSYHRFFRHNQAKFTENNEIAAWGTWYLATAAADDLTWKSGFGDAVRAEFVDKKILSNTEDSNFRAVNDAWPVFAFSKDLGNVGTDECEAVFTLGLTQDEVIDFAGEATGMTALPGLWSSFYSKDSESVVAFHGSYDEAVKAATALDEKIQKDSVAAAGQDYATITTLSVRQVFGALQFAGTPDKPYIFLKEISSNSDIQTVDVIFPAYPLLLYLNPELCKYLLDPLFENQESGRYPNKWAIHDLGTFPVAKGYSGGSDEPMPLEECGNMVIMTLAYANRTGDVDYLTAHYKLLSQWADFLVEDSLIPANQLSTDDFAGTLANQTNLALKGIIGLKAMSEIAQLTGNDDTFGSIADDYLRQWQVLGINKDASPPHTTLSYGSSDSHGLLYNLYSDRLLGLDFVPQSVYDMQSDFYPTVALEYGVPLDTRHTWTKLDWEIFCAAIAKPDTREMFISDIANWIGKTTTNRALTDLYDAGTGGYTPNAFVARPVVGGTFALLALPSSPSGGGPSSYYHS